MMAPKLFALLAAVAGVVAFHLLALPLPWLLGPLTFCLIAALVGVPLSGTRVVSDAMRTILGVAVGAAFTPLVLASIPDMWPTLVLVPFMVVAIGVLGIPFFQRICNYDAATSYYAAMPGGLADMILFGQEAGGNVRAISLIQATRVLVIVVSVPFILRWIWDADLTQPPGVPIGDIAITDLGVMLICAAIGWWVALKIGLFGAPILGPLIVTALAAMTGILNARPPAEAIWAAQFFIGLMVGSYYAGVTWSEVRRDLAAGLGFCALLVVLTFAIVALITAFDLAPGQEAFLAFAPGGQAELTVLALIVGADAAFVVVHHVFRVAFILIGAPIFARWTKIKGN